MNYQRFLGVRLRVGVFCSLVVFGGAGLCADNGATIARTPQPLRAEAAPVNRIIVKFRSSAGLARVGARAGMLSRVSVAAQRAGISPLVVSAARNAPAMTHLRTLAVGGEVIGLPRPLAKADADKLLAELAKDPAVEYAEPDFMMHLMQAPDVHASASALPNDPLLVNQWHFTDPVGGIDLPRAWELSQGEGIVVGVIDTGILPNHPDLAGNVLSGYDFITDSTVSRRATNDRVPGGFDLGDWEQEDSECNVFSIAHASSWHGTHVSGTIAEATGNGIGGAGVAFKAKILPVRAIGHCGGYSSDIADAIVWASGGHVDGVPDNTQPAEVINISLGGSNACSASTQSAIDGAVARGTTIVVSAGNSSEDVAGSSPAGCNNVIVVAATRVTGGPAFYTDFGTLVDLAAPGGGAANPETQEQIDGPIKSWVWQTGYTGKTTPTSGDYTYIGQGFAGTSMASPHVAGVAALVQSALIAAGKPALPPAALERALKRSARPFPVNIPAQQPIGSGIVDARAVLERVLRKCAAEDVACQLDAQPLRNGSPLIHLSNVANETGVFSFNAEAGKVLSLVSFGGSGALAMYVAYGREPSATDNDGVSKRSGTSQTIRFTAPRAGNYFIKLEGGKFDGVSLLARQ